MIDHVIFLYLRLVPPDPRTAVWAPLALHVPELFPHDSSILYSPLGVDCTHSLIQGSLVPRTSLRPSRDQSTSYPTVYGFFSASVRIPLSFFFVFLSSLNRFRVDLPLGSFVFRRRSVALSTPGGSPQAAPLFPPLPDAGNFRLSFFQLFPTTS